MTLLGIEELSELEELLRAEINSNLIEIITRLNRTDRLEELLELLGLDYLLKSDNGYRVFKSGKIIIIGYTDVKAEVLMSVAKALGIAKDRFEFYLEYEDAKKFNFRNIQWQPSYSAVLVGPMPHSGASKGDYSSVISAIESEEGYPPVIRMGSNALKITKSDFKCKLQEMISAGIIQ